MSRSRVVRGIPQNTFGSTTKPSGRKLKLNTKKHIAEFRKKHQPELRQKKRKRKEKEDGKQERRRYSATD